ncbi:MAG: glycosyl transferase, partial [Pseudanabaena sp. RU_4_16]|nr:glycosyl transferase [Pseudanabaena sp. RU_4_16]
MDSQLEMLPGNQLRNMVAMRTRWGLWFLLGLIAFVGLHLSIGMGFLSTGTFFYLPAFGAIAIITVRSQSGSQNGAWNPKHWFQSLQQQWPVWGQWVMLAVIIAIGFGLRVYDLDFVPYDADENTSLDAVKGILRTGAPEPASKIWYTRGPFFHYMSALWLGLVGFSTYNARLLIVLWGTAFLVVAFIFTRHITGKVWFALLIAAVFAIDPLELWNSRNFRFYQPVQCLNLLVVWLFCKAFIDRADKRYQYAFFVALTAALLHQEVSVTLLPGLLLGFIFFYRPFNWFADRPIIIGSFMVMSIYIYNG